MQESGSFRFVSALAAVAVCLSSQPIVAEVVIPTVVVGDVGNSPDIATGYGKVDYEFRIAVHEVTNSQYAAFLNAKAASDPLALYHVNMTNDPRGGIVRQGAEGSYTYTVKEHMGNKPVNFVGWYDALRFCNWLHNGQGDGDTEDGAYTLLGGTIQPTNGVSITRNTAAAWFLPSSDEWHKAAYYDPRSADEGGPPGDDHYWLYPTRSDDAPAFATADSMGNISNPGPNVANYVNSAGWDGQTGHVTTVGSAGPESASYYGTFDQGGNVWEWEEDLHFVDSRRFRGGGWNNSSTFLRATSLGAGLSPVSSGDRAVGFRVAAAIPEPSTWVLALTGILAWLAWSRPGRAALARVRVPHRNLEHARERARALTGNARLLCRYPSALSAAARAVSSSSR